MIVVVDSCQTLIVKRGWVAYDVSDFGEFRVGSDGLDSTSPIWEASSNYITNPNMEWFKLEIATFKFGDQMSLG